MLHPIYSTLVSRPDLIVDHLSAYAALAAHETANTGNDLKVRLIGWVVSALFGVLFLLFAGIAVMLGVMHGQFHWVLVGVPGAALLLALISVLSTRRPAPGQRFSEIRRQVAADLELLRAAGVPHER